MRANKHLLLWSSLLTLAVLAWAATEENFLRDWRRHQTDMRDALPPAEAAGFQVRLRQIVVPETGAADRCVSCHVGMAPGETAIEGDPVLGRHPDVAHDPAEFGCTICHGGQGRATLKPDAHGHVPHWPEPMLPKEKAYAACGACHSWPESPAMPRLAAAAKSFERADCMRCHRVDGRGGSVRPGDPTGKEGPDLSRAGARGFRPDWYAFHRSSREGGGKPLYDAHLSERERGRIETYLRSRVGAPGLMEAKAQFLASGCLGCHTVAGVGGDDGPELTRAGIKEPVLTPYARVIGPHTPENWHAEHFRSPARVVEGSRMPAMDLSEAEIERLSFHMLSLRRKPMRTELWPADRIKAERFGEREFARDGETLYGAFCSACHGARGRGMTYSGMEPFPAVAGPDFLRLASDAFIEDAIRRGRPGRRMPGWKDDLDEADIRKITRHLRRLGGGVRYAGDSKPPRWAGGDADRGAGLYLKSCAGCHGEDGAGKSGPAVTNSAFLESATDTFLYETIRLGRRGTSMPGFSKSSPSRRTLSEGEIEDIISFLRKRGG